MPSDSPTEVKTFFSTRISRLPRYHRRRRQPPGTPPGTLVAPEDATPTTIHVMAYDANGIVEHTLSPSDLGELAVLQKRYNVVWVNVDGLKDITLVEELGRLYNLHPLALEDVLSLSQRPKVEDYPDHLFIVTRMAFQAKGAAVPSLEQVGIFLGQHFVLTFQERTGDCLDPVRNRLRQNRGTICKNGTDYLAYALLDAIVDGYFPVLEAYSDRLDDLEDHVLDTNPDDTIISRIHDIKREMMMVRRAIWPQRDMLSALYTSQDKLIKPGTHPFLRDCHDHIIQLMDILETQRERASGLMELYLSCVSNHMNEVMKVLTVFATIFMPLSFIVGLYGMNFSHDASPYNMPELYTRYGYVTLLGVMLAIALGMVWYFKARGWIGRGRSPRN